MQKNPNKTKKNRTNFERINCERFKIFILQVSMPKRNKNGSGKNKDETDISALEAVLTQAILHEVKVKQMEKPKLVQIVIYESSV